jgi:PrtD family type I secretion system ABC transporter
MCRSNIYYTIFFSFFINLLMFVAPLHMLQIYDRVLLSRSEVTLVVITVLAIGLLVIYGLLEGVRSRLLVRTGLKFDEILNDKTFRAVFRRSVQQPRNATPQALRDMDSVREFLSGGAVIAICDAPWVPIFIAVGFLLHPLLGTVSLFGAIVIFLLALTAELSTRNLLYKGNSQNLLANHNVSTSLRNSEVVHALGMIAAIKRHWSENHDKALTFQATASDRAGTIMACSKFVRMALQVLILGVGAYLAVLDEITPGTMIAASILMGRALAPVEMAVGQWRSFVNSRLAYERLQKLLEATPEPEETMNLPEPTGNVRVDKAVLGAPDDPTVIIKGVSFNVEPGKALAIIGPSGSGKSSLAKALVGVWPVRSGSVRFDGAEINQWNPEKLGPYIGYMPQDVELFDGTVAQNIARFTEVDPDLVVLAAKKAGVHDLILTLPDGYDSNMGPSGQALSGGQRQRIALARALYGKPKILIFDEPNAHLDTMGETALANSIDIAKSDLCSIILISHKPSLLTKVEDIIVLKDGTVVSSGPRDQILSAFNKAGE